MEITEEYRPMSKADKTKLNRQINSTVGLLKSLSIAAQKTASTICGLTQFIRGKVMSTRSYICKENPDHTYTGIYCHWDGYPEHNGQILVEYYNDKTKVEQLLDLGDLSSLGEEIAPPPGVNHSFDSPVAGVCIAYHRDRGEEYEGPSLVTFEEYKKSWCEYMYVFGLDGKWRYFDAITEDNPNPIEFTEEWAQGYYEQPSANESNYNLTIDDIINGVQTKRAC